MKYGFTLFEFLLVLILAGILGFALYQTIDPKEQEKLKRDEQYKTEAEFIIASLQSYYKENGLVPWSPIQSSQSALAWTDGKDPKVGICADASCLSSGVLVGGNGLSSSILKSSLFASPESRDRVLVGENETQERRLYTCFIPTSKEFRLNWVDLFDIKAGTYIGKEDRPTECPAQPDWQNSSCYYCVSGKLH